jgi:hypothetical protein
MMGANTGMEIQVADPDTQFQLEMQRMADEIMDEEVSENEETQFQLEMQQMANEIMDEEVSENEEDDSCQYEDVDIIYNLLVSPEPHKDVHTMGITPQERQLAVELKQAAKELPELNVLSDMEYAQFAIFSQGNHADALKRMAAMQLFREVYQVDNTVEQGLFMLGEFMKQQEGLVLVLDVDRVTLEGLHGLNNQALNPRLATEPCSNGVDYNFRIFICGMYYYIRACQPCLGSVRAGIYTVADFENVGWRHFNAEFQYRFAGRLYGWCHDK